VQRIIFAIILAAATSGGYRYVAAQAGAAPREPFKLGTFERGGRPLIGVVLRDTQVVDLAEANAAFERRNAAGAKVRTPADMNELIERYDTDLKARLYAIVNDVAGAQPTPQYVYAMKDLKALPPVRPQVILNAGGNYEEHAQGIAQEQRGRAAPRPRRRRPRSPHPGSGSASRAIPGARTPICS